jgi:hypothetical protein
MYAWGKKIKNENVIDIEGKSNVIQLIFNN